MNYQVRTVVEIGPEQVRELHRVQSDPGALGAVLEAVARAMTEGRATCSLSEGRAACRLSGEEGTVVANVQELRVNYRSHNAFGDSLLTLEALLDVDLNVDANLGRERAGRSSPSNPLDVCGTGSETVV